MFKTKELKQLKSYIRNASKILPLEISPFILQFKITMSSFQIEINGAGIICSLFKFCIG